MISAPLSLDITTLGRFEIRRDHALLNGGNWHRRRVCDLFKLLITVEQHRLHREQIQEIFWPASSSEQAANSFGKTLYLLRRALEPDLPRGSSSSYVTLDRDILLLTPEHMRIDVDLFEASTRQLQIKMRSRSSGKEGELQCRALLDEFDRVLSLYSGDYLPEDLYEDWVQSRRDHLRRLYCWLLENAAELAMEAAMGLRASEYLQDLLERNPTDEQTHRQLMHVYTRIGRRSDAINQFQRLSQVLRDELHTNPLPETVELYRAIQSGHIASDLLSSYHLPARQDQAWHTLQVIETSRMVQSPDNRSKLVDRDEEMQRLQRAYLLAQAGQPRVTFICGEPGIGKTSLAREFCRQVEQRQQGRALWGYCYEMSRSLPYQPLVDAINTYARASCPEQLRLLLGERACYLAKVAPEVRLRLSSWLLAEAQSMETELCTLYPQNLYLYNLYDAVAHFFSALASERPLVIVLDDLQWADSATLELLGYLILRATHVEPAAGAPQPLFILLYRADEVDAEHPLRNLLTMLSRCDAVDELRLRRLGADAIQQLLVNIADQPIPLVCANEMYRYTEGNPFFIVEALLAMVQEGKIQRVEGRWQKMVPIEELELPQSLRLLIERRLMHFSSECHITLILAAVLGRHFNSAILSRACALPEEVVAEHIDDAIRGLILTPLADEKAVDASFAQGEKLSSGQDCDLSFTHDKIREVLYQDLNPLRRRAMHRRVARAIEAHCKHDQNCLQPYYSNLAYHYQNAADYEQAVDYFLKAADLAISQSCWQEAEQMGNQAMAISEMLHDRDLQSRVLWSRSTCACLRGEHTQAIQDVTSALQMACAEDGTTSLIYPQLLLHTARAYFCAGDLDNSQDYLDQGIELAREHGYRQLTAIGYRLQARILQAQNKFAAAQLYFEQALSEFATLNDTLEYARTQEDYGLFYLARNGPGDRERELAWRSSARHTFQRLHVKG